MNPRRSPSRRFSTSTLLLFAVAAVISFQLVFYLQSARNVQSSGGSSDGYTDALVDTMKMLNLTLQDIVASMDKAELELAALKLEAAKQPDAAADVSSQAGAKEQALAVPPPPLQRASEDVKVSAKKKFLVIGIPTVPRRAKYLQPTVAAIARQLPSSPADPLYNNVLVIVCNNRPGMHDEFKAVKDMIEGSEKKDYFEFIERTNPDPMGSKMDKGTPNLPGYKVRQQTMDVTTLLKEAKGKAHHYLFMEDDFELCPNAMQALLYLIGKAYRVHGNWLAIRTSYGLNGIILRDDDLDEMKEYYLSRYEARPPDHLMSEWTLKETTRAKSYLKDRTYICYKYNLFDHLGTVSSLRASSSPSYPRCYDKLGM